MIKFLLNNFHEKEIIENVNNYLLQKTDIKKLTNLRDFFLYNNNFVILTPELFLKLIKNFNLNGTFTILNTADAILKDRTLTAFNLSEANQPMLEQLESFLLDCAFLNKSMFILPYNFLNSDPKILSFIKNYFK